jgi:hypothetical protein
MVVEREFSSGKQTFEPVRRAPITSASAFGPTASKACDPPPSWLGRLTAPSTLHAASPMPHSTPIVSTIVIVIGLVLAFAFGVVAHRLHLPPLIGYLRRWSRYAT